MHVTENTTTSLHNVGTTMESELKSTEKQFNAKALHLRDLLKIIKDKEFMDDPKMKRFLKISSTSLTIFEDRND